MRFLLFAAASAAGVAATPLIERAVSPEASAACAELRAKFSGQTLFPLNLIRYQLEIHSKVHILCCTYLISCELTIRHRIMVDFSLVRTSMRLHPLKCCSGGSGHSNIRTPRVKVRYARWRAHAY